MQTLFFENLTRTRREYNRVMEPLCQRWALTHTELDILLFLASNPGMDRAADIVATLGLVKSHVSMSVNHLEQLGLLLRQADPGNRRTARLVLTPAAAPITQETAQQRDAFISRILDGVTPEELAVFYRISQITCRNLEKINTN